MLTVRLMDVRSIPLVDVVAFEGRPRDAAAVTLLKDSLAAVGLLNPITVTHRRGSLGIAERDFYHVVSGRHRVEAARQLMWTEIAAVIVEADVRRAELMEIDENLVRHDLTDAQRAVAHSRREALMVEMGLARTKGGDQTAKLAVSSYSKKAAQELGLGERTVRRDLARGKKIAPAVLADVQGTREDAGVVLDKLAAAPREEQPAQLALIRQQRADAEASRKEAQRANRDTDRTIALGNAQQFADWLNERVAPAELPALIAWLEGCKPRDVIAALRRAAA